MRKVIKAWGPHPRSLVHYERVPLEDLAKDGLDSDEIITEEMRREQERREAEQRILNARAEGHQQGVEVGKAEYLASVGESAEALKAAADELVRMREVFLESLEPQVVELAILIAERVLQRELATDKGAIARTVRRALEHVTDTAGVTVSVNPKDLDALRAEKIHLLETFEGIRQLTVRGDASISPGGCTVDTESVHIDARVESQLARIIDVLREPSETPSAEQQREDDRPS